MNNETEINADVPITADWLRKNTRIGGWLRFLMWVLVLSGLRGLGEAFKVSVSDCGGSSVLAMAGVAIAIILLAVAIWAVISFARRRPAAVFWAKYYMLISLTLNLLVFVLPLDRGAEAYKDYGQAMAGTFWSIVWLVYLHVSERVSEVIPKRYRRAGFGTWAVAVILVLLPLVWWSVGVCDMVLGYHGNVEIRQSELPEGEYTDGHVVFKMPEGWSFAAVTNEEVVVCTLTNRDGFEVRLFSAFDPDDSKENFENTVTAAEYKDFVSLTHRVVVDDVASVNGHKCYYRVVEYMKADGEAFYWHIALVSDSSTCKSVVESGYFSTSDDNVMKNILRSIRFSL